MKQPINLRMLFNDDDEIITRIDECERLKAECPNKDCPYQSLLSGRIVELKIALRDHILF